MLEVFEISRKVSTTQHRAPSSLESLPLTKREPLGPEGLPITAAAATVPP